VHVWAFVVTLVGVIVAYAIWSAGQKQLHANTAIFRLGEPLSVIARGEASAEDMAKVAEKYEGTSAAERALMQSGALFFQEKEYQKALDTFTQFSQKHPQSSLAGSAAYGVAYARMR
jgi:TolA-binding protein